MEMWNDLGADPYEFFGSAAGPRAIDLIGPGSSILDTYVDGMPVSNTAHAISEHGPASNHGMAAMGGLLSHNMVVTLAMIAGAVMVYHATK